MALRTYKYLKDIAKQNGWAMNDGKSNDFKAYARLALKEYCKVEEPKKIIPK